MGRFSFWFLFWLAAFVGTELLLGVLAVPAWLNIVAANNALWFFIVIALLKYFQKATSRLAAVADRAMQTSQANFEAATAVVNNAVSGQNQAVQAGFQAVQTGFEMSFKSVAFIAASRAEIEQALLSGRAAWAEDNNTLLLDTGIAGPVQYTD
jgi:hypothetical protein